MRRFSVNFISFSDKIILYLILVIQISYKYFLSFILNLIVAVKPHKFLFVFTLFFFFQCASKGIPGGGPVDNIPPRIVCTYPEADSTNISNINKIEIHFSERMNEPVVEKSIFISPPLKYKIKWSGGDELKLIVTDTLRSNQTYVITLGAGAEDFHKNRMKSSYQFAFSTGDKIDRGEISGKVYDITPKESFYIYAYRIINIDSLNPSYNIADFLTMPDDEGNFNLSYLAEGFYRVFVIEDQNSNLLLDGNYERIGIPFRDVLLDSFRMSFTNLNFKITRIDTVPPYIVDARSINNQTVIVRFTEPIKYLDKNMLQIVDTLGLTNIDIFAYTVNKEDEKQYIIYTAIQDSNLNYRINIIDIADTSGNLQTIDQSYIYQGSAVKDTAEFKLIQISPADSAVNQPLSVKISVQFSHPIDTLSFIESFIYWQNDDSTKILSGKWEWKNLSAGYFHIIPYFQPGQKYTFQINTKNIISLWGEALPDSQIVSRFFMISEDEFGSLSGKYTGDLSVDDRVYIKIFPLDKKREQIMVPMDTTKKFFVKWIQSGKYKIGGFFDRDRNKKYSYGNLYPFTYSEPFYIKPDTLRIRKRWESSGIEFIIPGIRDN
jgi:hypothetical protein